MSLLIKNGTIVDGSGSDRYCGDILIEDEKITKIAQAIDPGADTQVIDAKG